jgi:methionyl aminopeptidase
MKGLATVRAGSTLLELAGAVQDHVEAHSYAVVEDFTGHGVGRNLHEEPSVFNFRTRDLPDLTLRPGMTLAVDGYCWLHRATYGCALDLCMGNATLK